ncbi:peptidase [Sphingomonas sp. AP4-R1]|uniref:M14 family metallopeptidase n=1 Tax=Sphingomonas sp. AP4-R1 TaxID=2735134 RepID=UPI0014933793|nr:M14 metallopeptidase family protein [Sphingomonas sp. AP4-R1]QJU57988.1 peptidase [Sphingomonas sp. AP4-R1]
MVKRGMLLGAAAIALMAAAAGAAGAAGPITPPVAGVTAPSQFFPQEPGSDYFLANYTQYEAYLRKLATESNRMKLVEIGKSAEGRTMVVAIVSTPENLAKMEDYRLIAKRLAKAEGLTDETARELAAKGKSIVWIDAGLHATETITTQSQIHVLYRMLTATDAETMKILDNEIILFGQDNPDGLQLVADWYMRNGDPKKREMRSIPRLYQKYIGHDNNRDSFMSQQPETTNVNKMLFREWYPEIVYNMHQTGPEGMVVFVPPFRDPFNYNYDPLLITELDEVGFAMHSGLIAEGKAGSGARSAANYSTWHNGMERSVSYFHNSIGLLTEIIGGPTPEMIPLIPDQQLARNDVPMPVRPREWHLKDSLDYTWTMNRAVMRFAADNRERLLFNIYRMGSNAIARGKTDSWTTTPNDIDLLKAAAKEHPVETANMFGGRTPAADPALYDKILRDPAKRDPRGYVITTNQKDMPTTIVFLNTLIKNGVDVLKATKPFTVAGKSYPAGSFVVRTDQAYRPHVLDMFEPQDHPNNLAYPGGPPIAPYDITGYNLTYQMGFSYDRVLDAFDGPFEKLPDQLLTAPAGKVIGTGKAGWLISHETDNGYTLTNRLLKAGAPVFWLKAPVKAGKASMPAGTVWVPASAQAASIIADGTKGLGIDAYAVAAKPTAAAIPLKPVRIGLVDQYGGVIPAGWTKWVLEQFEFPYTVVYPQELDAGNLNAKYDVLLFADGTVPSNGDGAFRGRPPMMPKAEDIPAEFRPWLGTISDTKTVPQLAAFAKAGGTIVTMGSATRLATALGTDLKPALVTTVNGKQQMLDGKTFYIPGSILQATVDNSQPLAYGLPAKTDIFFNQNQTFTLPSGAAGTSKIAWFDSATPLRSGWAWGQDKLNGTTAIADVDLGRGKLFVMGPEVAQRAQSYMTFKFLFNGLLYGPAVAASR